MHRGPGQGKAVAVHLRAADRHRRCRSGRGAGASAARARANRARRATRPRSSDPSSPAARVAFFVFGLAAVFGLSGAAQRSLQQLIGAGARRCRQVRPAAGGRLRHPRDLPGSPAASVRASCSSAGRSPAYCSGIAAQQSLANLFAGLVLLFAQPVPGRRPRPLPGRRAVRPDRGHRHRPKPDLRAPGDRGGPRAAAQLPGPHRRRVA